MPGPRWRWPGIGKAAAEYFAVYLATAGALPGAARPLAPPARSYLADPFLVRLGGVPWLLAECFDYRTARGRIVAADIREARPRWHDIALRQDSHASFPFVFAHDGATWLLPETCAAGELQLYRLAGTPPRAEFAGVLLSGIDCADSVCLAHGDRWWLLTSVRRGHRNRVLEVYHSDSPVGPRWVPHPVNAEALFAGLPHGTGRNAGPPFRADGRLYRPVQVNRGYYGERTVLAEIERLTPESYRERPARPLAGATALVEATATHHVSVLDDLVAFDRRERAPLAGLLPWLAPVRDYTLAGSDAGDRTFLAAAYSDGVP